MSFGEGNLRTAVAELQGENEALRQLVLDMLPCYRWSDCCGRPCQNEGELYASCPKDVERRVKALGIEVDR